MPINICRGCGMITGYATCPHCGSKGMERQSRDHTERTMQPEPKANPPKPTFISHVTSRFKAWRGEHLVKLAERKLKRAD
jgi:RecJ-like exonuclease